MIEINMLPLARRYVPLRLVHVELEDAQERVRCWHRHSAEVTSHRFSLGVVDDGDRLRGVAICGRPNAPGLDCRTVLDVARVATDGTRNACSFLYRASARPARSLGYRRVVTYTKADEPGTSLVAAGFKREAEVTGKRKWSCPSRPRPEQELMFGLPKREAVARVRWGLDLEPPDAPRSGT